MAQRPAFNPEDHDLDKSFRMSKSVDLKGSACSLREESSDKLLKIFKDEENELLSQDQNAMGLLDQPQSIMPQLGESAHIGIRPCNGGFSMIQSTNMSPALVDDPYMMGKIACSSTLADLYAIGILKCDTIVMQLGLPNKFSDKEREAIAPLIIQGFKDTAKEAKTDVIAGHTFLNPWCVVGGTTTVIIPPHDIITPDSAIVGDVLVLTKPLGTSVAVQVHQFLELTDKWNRIKPIAAAEDIERAYQEAMYNMARLNKNAADTMRKFNAHGATNVDGYGILGAAKRLVKNQRNEVNFVIHNLPVIGKMSSVAKPFAIQQFSAYGNTFKLTHGISPETSGGLLIAFPREQAAAYCKEIERVDGHTAWIIGIVEKGERKAKVIDKPRVIEVTTKMK
ncbi:selenide, water dikinase 1-like [Anneissia japonica]|uniref:selenide, water dikinase 1-like n=1 Tax=Anneissia japonica TaxID=1529436 RepID=UPI00142591D0|nr:selenide, water dikinase 1-like [Anneissia japonica]